MFIGSRADLHRSSIRYDDGDDDAFVHLFISMDCLVAATNGGMHCIECTSVHLMHL